MLPANPSLPDDWLLYRHMLRSRLYEVAVSALWHEGLISGQMHLGTGEEGIVAGTVIQLEPGDAMALDHRCTPPMLMRGVDPLLMLREFLGRPDGLCSGMGGHMHLYSREHLAASSGIVGSSGPAAVGFALAGQHLRPGSVSLAFFGEGAVNEGMMMEAMNLAVVWRLPVLFVCKDNDWSITTESRQMRGGDFGARAAGFGMDYIDTDGTDAAAVWRAAEPAILRARNGGGPTFLRARCRHFDGHFLGYQVLRISRKPIAERRVLPGLVRSVSKRSGASLAQRLSSLSKIGRLILDSRAESQATRDDPVRRQRIRLQHDPERLQALEKEVLQEIHADLEDAIAD